ncbi:MAG: hypothetical protein QM778_24650 [Myxococcales bacterium]
MALRSMFKGSLVVGKIKLPVKLYAAVEERRMHFRFLSPKDHQPVTQQMVDTTTGKVVSSRDIRKGFHLDDGSFVLLDPGELKSLQPKASRDLRVTERLSQDSVPAQWFLRPYYLGPDGSTDAYTALHTALRESGELLLTHWVMRGNEYVGVVRAEPACLSITTLRHADEVVDASQLTGPSVQASAKEVSMAKQLVEAFTGEFDPALFQDEYTKRLEALVAAKRAGKKVRLSRASAKPASEGSLERALSQSLKRAKKPTRKERAVA